MKTYTYLYNAELHALFLCSWSCLDFVPHILFIHGIVFFKDSHSVRLNSSLSDNMTPEILVPDNPRHLYMLSWKGKVMGVGGVLFVSSRVKLSVFVGHAPLSPAAVWVSVSSPHVFWARARRDAGPSLLLWFSVMHSLTRHSRQITLHLHILPFFSLSPFFLFLSVSKGSEITGCHKHTN